MIDAVWSISAQYDAVVAPLVRRVAAANADQHPVIDATALLPPDPLPLTLLLARYPDAAALRAVTNGQRTSTRGGIEKAEAVLRYAHILTGHGITDLAGVADLMADPQRWSDTNRALAGVPGEGAHGVRRSYLWMLCGCDDVSKPDRMILRWLARHGIHATPDQARAIVEDAAAELTVRLGRPVTAWMVDHAIWTAQRPQRGRAAA
ncbi:hypothetical protein [Virgisporangium ochraceum]|uniref:hypothetical protein n=1 Tax=Virgisporangium ochraceum TaxID=65505 RepID=UPI0019406553|nr:hypothetical protein [Virgisporangium ochraceum]